MTVTGMPPLNALRSVGRWQTSSPATTCHCGHSRDGSRGERVLNPTAAPRHRNYCHAEAQRWGLWRTMINVRRHPHRRHHIRPEPGEVTSFMSPSWPSPTTSPRRIPNTGSTKQLSYALTTRKTDDRRAVTVSTRMRPPPTSPAGSPNPDHDSHLRRRPARHRHTADPATGAHRRIPWPIRRCQAGPEFARWLAARGPPTARPDGGPPLRYHRDGNTYTSNSIAPHRHNAFNDGMRALES